MLKDRIANAHINLKQSANRPMTTTSSQTFTNVSRNSFGPIGENTIDLLRTQTRKTNVELGRCPSTLLSSQERAYSPKHH